MLHLPNQISINMKKLLTFLLFAGLGLYAQHRPFHQQKPTASPYIKVTNVNVDVPIAGKHKAPETPALGAEGILPSHPHHAQHTSHPGYQRSTGTKIGDTYYDLQTNYGMCRRVVTGSNGEVYASWTMSRLQDDAYADRGTGFNEMIGGNWSAMPTTALENKRTGWPNMGITASGRLFSITHSATQGMHMVYRDAGSSTWVNKTIGVEVSDLNATWPRVAVTGDTIYTIIGRDGTQYSASGIPGGLKYIRSFDNGDTWEALELNPLLSDFYFDGTADSYFIDAQGSTVAFAIANYAAQIILYKSNDAGDTWNTTIIQATSNPFIDSANALSPEYLEPVATSSGSLSLVLDSSGNAHIVMDRTFNFRDLDETQKGVFYLPNATCLMYWTEGMAKPKVIGQTVLQDTNQDGETLIITQEVQIQSYGTILIGHPSIGIDANDNLYVAYDSVVDGEFEIEPITGSTGEEGRMFRDVYMIKKQAGNSNWEGPINVSNSNDAEDVYPSIQKNIDDQIHLIYQSDPKTGTHLQNSATPPQGHALHTLNEILYVSISPDDIVNPTSPINTSPAVQNLISTVPTQIIEGCAGSIGGFDGTHALDYPDGEITENIIVAGVNVEVPGDYPNGWVINVTDSDGNTSNVDILGTNGNPIPVTVLEDTDDPIIISKPFDIIETDVNGNYQATLSNSDEQSIEEAYNNPAYAGKYLAFVPDPNYLNIDVLQYSAYIDLDLDVLDQTTIFGCPPSKSTTGSVDTDILGDYLIEYNATDVNDKVAEQVDRIVHVIASDETAPIIEVYDLNGDIIEDGGSTIVAGEEGEVFPGLDYYIFDNVNGDDLTVEIDGEVNIEVPGSYDLIYTVTDASGNSSTYTVTVIVEDITPPTISLAPGSLPIIYMCQYSDIIPTHDLVATDNFDGDITGSITNNANQVVNAQLPANYNVTYTVSDAAGNVQTYSAFIVVAASNTNNNNINCTTGIEDIMFANNIILYPSPVKDILQVYFKELLSANISLVITDVKGAEVYRNTLFNSQKVTIDISGLSSGIYLVRFTSDKGTAVKKIVVE